MNFRQLMDEIIEATEEAAADGDRDITVCMGPETLVEFWSIANFDGGYDARMDPRQPGIAYMVLGYPVASVVGIPQGEFVISSRPRIKLLLHHDWDNKHRGNHALTYEEMKELLEEVERQQRLMGIK